MMTVCSLVISSSILMMPIPVREPLVASMSRTESRPALLVVFAEVEADAACGVGHLRGVEPKLTDEGLVDGTHGEEADFRPLNRCSQAVLDVDHGDGVLDFVAAVESDGTEGQHGEERRARRGASIS